MTELGNRISLYRQNAGMTQEELADKLGVTPQAVSKWERGVSLPDVTLLAQICHILHCSADSLLGTQSGDYSETQDADNTPPSFMLALRTCQEPLAFVFGTDFLCIFTEGLGRNYLEMVTACRERLAASGILMPVLRIRDDIQLAPKEFMILSYRRILYRETVEQVDETTFSHIMDVLYHTVEENYGYILNRDIVRALVDNLAIDYPALVRGVIPEKISYRLLQHILKRLLQRGDHPCYLIKIIETAEDLLTDNPEIGIDELVSGIAAEIEQKDNFDVVMHREHHKAE